MDESSAGDAGQGPDGPSTGAPSTVELDGRRLAYAEYGDPGGRPVFAFHGVLGSRLTWSVWDESARRAGVRLVAPERPGFGHSEFCPGRSLLDWPADVAALADHLGVDRFGVVGFSAGGPHAVACARAVPARLRGVALVSSVAPPSTHGRADPFDHAFISATRFVPGFSRTTFETAAWLADHSRSGFRASLLSTAGPPDRALFDGPVGDRLVADAAEALRRGARGPARDLRLVGNDWGFDAGAVEHAVSLFHGSADETVDPAMARAFAGLLADCDLHVSDRAHYSTLVAHADAVLARAAGE